MKPILTLGLRLAHRTLELFLRLKLGRSLLFIPFLNSLNRWSFWMIRLWDSKEILHTLGNYFAISTRDVAPQLIQDMAACYAWSSGRTCFSYLLPICLSLPFFFFICVVSFFRLRGFLFCLHGFFFICVVSFLFAFFFGLRGFSFTTGRRGVLFDCNAV